MIQYASDVGWHTPVGGGRRLASAAVLASTGGLVIPPLRDPSRRSRVRQLGVTSMPQGDGAVGRRRGKRRWSYVQGDDDPAHQYPDQRPRADPHVV